MIGLGNGYKLCFISLLIRVAFSDSQNKWFVASEDKCQFTVNNGLVIKFSENPSLFVNNIKTKDLAECRRSCCNHDTCNGYVWDVVDKTENCKLLKCSSQGTDCKKALSAASKSVANILNDIPESVDTSNVGFITGINDNPAPESTTTTSTVKPPLNQTHSNWLKQKLGIGNTQLPENAVAKKGTNLQQSSQQGTLNIPHKAHDGVTKDKNNFKGDTSVGVQTASTTSTATPSLSMTNSEDKKPDASTTLSSLEIHSTHTNTISLTVAFLIGIGFLFSVLYMIGRRWVEGVKDSHKQGYTRVSYLLNGV